MAIEQLISLSGGGACCRDESIPYTRINSIVVSTTLSSVLYEWHHFDHRIIERSVRQWRVRLHACVNENRSHLEHTLYSLVSDLWLFHNGNFSFMIQARERLYLIGGASKIVVVVVKISANYVTLWVTMVFILAQCVWDTMYPDRLYT